MESTQITFPPRQTVNLLDVPVVTLDRASLTNCFEEYLSHGVRGWISNANIHAMNLAVEHHWFREFQQNALMVFCDGEGVRLGARLLGKRIPERIALTDWIYDICQVAARNGAGIFLLGGKEGVAETAAATLAKLVPGTVIAGTHHGFFPPTEAPSVVSKINSSRARILLVCMGMPYQERWVLDHLPQLAASLILNGGSVLEYVAGTKRRCPPWMAKHGMEWIYRLFQEPARLWKRYLLGNPLFLLRIIQSRFRT